LTATAVSAPRIVVLACGNPSRGDDALGPALLERVEKWIDAHPDRRVAAVGDFQLQVEHALDMEGCELVLFVDANAAGPESVTLRPVMPSLHASFSTHALSPEALLQTFVSMACGPVPSAFSLGVRGYSFDLGQPLSARARQNLELAWGLLHRLLEDASRMAWQQRCASTAYPRVCPGPEPP
jgi:hydrogenase maturation protease